MSGFSIIIPVLNESERISGLTARLSRLDPGYERETIVVDGSPDCDTIRAIADPSVRCLSSQRGRAMQMNAGAAESAGDVLLFLHADTRLPDHALSLIDSALADRTISAGAFNLGIDSTRRACRLMGRIASLRSRITRIPYGDQAIFVRRDVFIQLGGYRDIPLMEDVDFMMRIRKRGLKIEILPQPVLTSPRRLESEGSIRCTLRNWLIMAAYTSGVSPERLARYYRQGAEAYRRVPK